MESLEKQILVLSDKVDAIYSVIERLDVRLSEALSTHETLEHKDVLIDGLVYPEMKYESRNRQVTPEIQIQRLTTQLTAAYHRIAALEEQLVRQRVY